MLIGFVINGSARGAAMQTRVSGRIEGVSVADVMDREPVAIPSEISVERALDEYFLRYRWGWFPVVDAAHHFQGLVVRDRADEVPETSRATSLVSELLESDDGTFQVRDDAPLDSLLANTALRRFGALMAVDADGRLSGVVTIEQVGGRSATVLSPSGVPPQAAPREFPSAVPHLFGAPPQAASREFLRRGTGQVLRRGWRDRSRKAGGPTRRGGGDR